MTGGAKNSARRGRCCSIELIRAGFEPFRARGIPKFIVRTKGGRHIRSAMARPRRGSKPARANDGANHAAWLAEFLAPPVLGLAKSVAPFADTPSWSGTDCVKTLLGANMGKSMEPRWRH
jgi:hypothetical protein